MVQAGWRLHNQRTHIDSCEQTVVEVVRYLILRELNLHVCLVHRLNVHALLRVKNYFTLAHRRHQDQPVPHFPPPHSDQVVVALPSSTCSAYSALSLVVTYVAICNEVNLFVGS